MQERADEAEKKTSLAKLAVEKAQAQQHATESQLMEVEASLRAAAAQVEQLQG